MSIRLLFAFFLSIVSRNAAQKCFYPPMVQCVMIASESTAEFEVPLPTNEKEFTKKCEVLENVRNCMYNFSKSCKSLMDRIVGDFIFSGTGQKMKDFCKPGSEIRKDYLKEAQCIKDNYGGMAECVKDNLASIQSMYKDTIGYKVPFFCCGLNRLRKCMSDHYGNKCNQKVVELVDLQLEFVFSEWVIAMCNPYADAKDECPELPTKEKLDNADGYGFVYKYVAAYARIK